MPFAQLVANQASLSENADAGPLTTVTAIRSLTPDEANEARPVEFTGVVTLLNSTNANWMDLFVQDDTSGIYVQLPFVTDGLQMKTRVRVTGVSRAGLFSPVVIVNQIEALGVGTVPAALPFNFSHNDGRWLDAQFVQAYCLVREVASVGGYPGLLVEGAGGPGIIEFRTSIPSQELSHHVGSIVHVNGVCSPEFDENGKLTGSIRIIVQSREDISTTESSERVSTNPIRSTAYLKRFLPSVSPIPFVKMAGVVTGQLSEDLLLVQDGSGGYTVRLLLGSSKRFAPGTLVEVQGFLIWNGDRIAIRSADVSVRGFASLPAPREILSELDLGALDACRVRFQGRVTETGDGHMTLTSEGVTISVRVPGNSGRIANEGSLVTVTGTLTSRFDVSTGLIVIPLSRADVVVSAPADRPWVTRTQAATLLAALIAVLVLSMAWVVALRRAVRTRTHQLFESEQKFATTFHSSPDAVVLTRKSDGVFLEVNLGFCQLTGFDREQAIGKSSLNLAWCNSNERTQMLDTIRLAGSIRDFSATLQDAQGRAHDVLISSTPVVVGGVDCLLGVIHDVTEKNRAERSLAESERKYRELVEHANSIILRWSPEGQITLLNEFGQQFFGYSSEEIVGRHVMDTIVPATESTGRDLHGLMAEICANPKRFEQNTNENMRRNGERVWIAWTNRIVFDDRGQIVEILSVGTDVTDHRRMEQALAASERKFATLFHMSPIAMVLSTCEGVLIDVNQAFSVMFAVPREQTVGRKGVDVPGLYASSEDRDDLFKMLIRDGRIRNFVRTRPRADGASITTISSAEMIDLDGEKHILTALADISLQKQAEELLHDANLTLEQRVADRTDELAAANKELEAFCYSVSHDLRAPLRSIDGFSQAVLEDYHDRLDPEGIGFLQRVRAAAERMGELIDDLLNLSRVSRAELHRERVDLSVMATEIVESLRQETPERMVDVFIVSGLITDGDKNLLRILLDNLIGNAWKYTGKTPNPRIELGWEAINGTTTFFVRDNGAGFDPAYADKLFQPFQRLHRMEEFPGHGIGLATVLRIVRRHGGQVSASGSVGNGAVFRYTIGEGSSGGKRNSGSKNDHR